MIKLFELNEEGLKKLIPGQSVDCVVIGFQNSMLKVLIMKWKEFGVWALPGGFVNIDENIDVSAIRILKDRTGLRLPFLKQFYTFGNVDRKVDYTLAMLNGSNKKILKSNNAFGKWLKQRFISTGYLSLVDIDKCKIEPDPMSDACEWVAISDLPDLIYDHNEMIDKALDRIKIEINYLPIGITLLPEKFTMKELQQLYEAILKIELDRGNFQKKLLKLNILIRLGKQTNGGAHKAPYLYRFDEKAYKLLLKRGFGYIS